MRYASSPRIARENTCLICCLRLEGTDEQTLSDRILEMEHKMERLTSDAGTHAANVTGTSSGTVSAPPQTRAVKTSVPMHENTNKTTKNVSGDSSVWKEMMSMIQRSDITLWSFLSQGKLISDADWHYCWQATNSAGEDQYITLLNAPEKASYISARLSEITGHPCQFQAVGHLSDSSAGKDEESYMAQMYETFGRNSVDIID